MRSRTALARRRIACLVLGAGAGVLWLTGWALLTFLPPAPGAGGPGDALLLAAVLPAGVALLLLPGAPPHAAGQGRTVVDGLIVSVAAFLTAWVSGLDIRFQATAGSGMALVALHGLGIVAVASMAIVMLTRAAPNARRTLALAAAGLGAIAVADAALIWLRLASGFAGAWSPTVLAVAGFGLLAAATRAPSGSGPGLPTRASVYIPSVPLSVGLVALCAEAIGVGRLSDILIASGVALVILVIARQIFALLENIAYWRDLEATIEAQTDDLRHREARFRSLVQNSSDVITVISPDGVVRYTSPSVRGVFGHRPELLEAVGLRVLFAAEDLAAVWSALAEIEPGSTRTLQSGVTHLDGRPRRVEIVASNLVDDPDVGGYVLNIRDDTDRRALEDQLAHMAFHDPLTDLANRALFRNRAEHALDRRRAGGLIAALFIDLDDFKNVNDSLGHGVGDDLLVLVAERLRQVLRPSDTVGRLGGDEFAVLLEDVDDEVEPVRAAERILSAMNEPYVVGNRSLYTRASIGIATASTGDGDAGELLRNADTAMYTAKARGKGRFALFDEDMHGSVSRRMELEADLRLALERGDIHLAYQPIVCLVSGRIAGLEALARWDHPRRGPVGPNEFIPVAEESGLILPLGRSVLHAAAAQMHDWHQRFPSSAGVEMGVNVSPSQLRHPGIGDDVRDALDSSGLLPSRLLLEVTESLLLDDTEPTIAKLEGFRRDGVKIAIDDFGTGYSSLSYLLRLPVDHLKIDRCFVDPMGPGSQEAALVRAIVTMGHELGLKIVAEGIETEQQMHELVATGCDLGQGYLLGRPVPAEQVEALLATAEEVALLTE